MRGKFIYWESGIETDDFTREEIDNNKVKI